MKNDDISLFLTMNEPTFDVADKQYSVCNPGGKSFATWDSDGNTYNFQGLDDLLDHWIVDGKSFRDIVQSIMDERGFYG